MHLAISAVCNHGNGEEFNAFDLSLSQMTTSVKEEFMATVVSI